MDRSQEPSPPLPPEPPCTPCHSSLLSDYERVDAPSDEEEQDALAGCSPAANPVFRPGVGTTVPRQLGTRSFPSPRYPLSPPPPTRAMSDRPLTVLTSPRQRHGDCMRVAWHENHVESAGLLHSHSPPRRNEYLGSSARRRALSWSVAQQHFQPLSPQPRSASLDFNDLEQPPLEEEDSENDEDSLQNPDLHVGPRSAKWRMARVALVVCAYISLASQPTRLSRLIRPSPRRTEHDPAFSPAHGREVAFPPLNVESSSSREASPETATEASPQAEMKQKRRKRPPALAHARVSSRGAPVFELKQPALEQFVLKDDDSQKQTPSRTEKAPFFGLLAWIVLLWLVLETGCREAQRRWSQVQQRRMRDVWQQRRLDE